MPSFGDLSNLPQSSQDKMSAYVKQQQAADAEDARSNHWYDYFIPTKGKGPAGLFTSGDPPPPPDYMGITDRQGQIASQLLEQQTLANRSNQSNPFGYSNWQKGDNGQWTQNSGFNGQMGGLFGNLQSQAANAWSTPLDNGQQARQHAEDAIYGQAQSRLDPMWNQREEQNRTRLINQGFDPNSQAYQQQMGSFGRDRNDAYQGAMNNAVMGGGQEASRQQAMDLQSRNAPLSQMGMMQGWLPGNNGGTAGLAKTPDYLGAASSGYGSAMSGYNAGQAQNGQNQAAGLAALLALL